MTGTPYNWLGKSCYAADGYMNNTLMYDFRLYNEALSFEDVAQLDGVVENLNDAYSTNVPDAVFGAEASSVSIDASIAGQIVVTGATEGTLVSVYDISGREVVSTDATTISLEAGIYIVKVASKIEKVIVK